MGVSYKAISPSSITKEWFLRITQASHNGHEMVPNPLSYIAHRQRQPEWQKSLELATTHRVAQISHKSSQRILDANDEGLEIDRTSYYHINRRSSRLGDSPKRNELDEVLEALLEAGFEYRPRYHYEIEESGNRVEKELIQIVAALNTQMILMRKFMSNWYMEADATFRTNNLKLLLISVVGITSTERSFPGCLSFSRFDNRDTYDFLFDFMNVRVFGDVIPPPRIIVADQGKGLIASYAKKFPGMQLQHCEWHAAENIRAAITRGRYTKEERQDLHNLTWNYIKSSTTETLETNRSALCDELKEDEVRYIRENWVPKEAKIIRYYTKLYANLGVHGTSRTEGLHPVLKKELSPSTPLPLAIKRVAKAVIRVVKELAKAEQEGLVTRPRTLDIKAFQLVLGKITIQALNRISPEWNEAKKLALLPEGAADYSTVGGIMRQGIDNLIEPGQCMCENPVRFSLPCRHNLVRSVRNGFAFPILLIYSR
jgi:hypothetical protein